MTSASRTTGRRAKRPGARRGRLSPSSSFTSGLSTTGGAAGAVGIFAYEVLGSRHSGGRPSVVGRHSLPHSTHGVGAERLLASVRRLLSTLRVPLSRKAAGRRRVAR